MKEIIPPVSRKAIIAELKSHKFLRYTRFGENEIYVVTAHDSPSIMREIGRLRELTFRDSGGGIREALDIDAYDKASDPYRQLIVWNTKDKEILGGYRFRLFRRTEGGQGDLPHAATEDLFWFSEEFRENYLPYAMDLGRGFIQPRYQPSRAGKEGFYSLDNLWDGLGGLVADHQPLRYLFGRIVIYANFDPLIRDMVMYFLEKHFKRKGNLIKPREPLSINTATEKLEAILVGKNYKEDFNILNQQAKMREEIIPPLINAYMNLSSTMCSFGSALDPAFGRVEETCVMVTIADIYEKKIDRYVRPYKQEFKML